MSGSGANAEKHLDEGSCLKQPWSLKFPQALHRKLQGLSSISISLAWSPDFIPTPVGISQIRGQRSVLWPRSISERLFLSSTGKFSTSGQKNGRKVRIYTKNYLISKASYGFCSKFPRPVSSLGCYMQGFMVLPSGKGRRHGALY